MSSLNRRTFTILTEVTSDLPESYYQEHDIRPVPMQYTLDGTEHEGGVQGPEELHLFYDKLREGVPAKTSAVSPEQMTGLFRRELEADRDVLYLGFSSGLTSGYQSALLARDSLLEEYPGRIVCVDSLCASLGQGLFLDYIVRKRDEGLDLEACGKAAEEIRQHVCHYFTVDDLNHLYRGGRVSKTAAIFGTMLGIKPVMHVDEEGRLIPHGKVRGRRQSLDSLVASMGGKLSQELPNPYVFISHGDCEADARYVADQVKSRYGVPCKVMNPIGPIVGAHSGPGTVALFFLGKDRAEKRL